MTPAKALEIWSVQSLCDLGIVLSILSWLLHIGRPYFERIQARLTLRMAAELWWLGYIGLRDGALLIALLTGLFCLNLDLMADIKIGLPFVPLGTVALAGAVWCKVFRNAEDVNANWRASVRLAGIGALLNMLGFVLVMEAPGGEYEAAKTLFWRTMVSWRSNQNPGLATLTFYLTAATLAVLAIAAAVKAARLCREKRGERNDRVQP